VPRTSYLTYPDLLASSGYLAWKYLAVHSHHRCRQHRFTHPHLPVQGIKSRTGSCSATSQQPESVGQSLGPLLEYAYKQVQLPAYALGRPKVGVTSVTCFTHLLQVSMLAANALIVQPAAKQDSSPACNQACNSCMTNIICFSHAHASAPGTALRLCPHGLQVPSHQHSLTEVHLFATAGFRVLAPRPAAELINSCRAFLATSNFKFRDEWATVMSGKIACARQNHITADPCLAVNGCSAAQWLQCCPMP